MLVDTLDLESQWPRRCTSFASASDRRPLESPAQLATTNCLAGAGSLCRELETILDAAENESTRVYRDLGTDENAAGKRLCCSPFRDLQTRHGLDQPVPPTKEVTEIW